MKHSREQKLAILYEAQNDVLQAIEDVQLFHMTPIDDSEWFIRNAIANLEKLLPTKKIELPNLVKEVRS